MPEAERAPQRPVRAVATGRRAARIAEPGRERPSYEGLFREPDWPPVEETED